MPLGRKGFYVSSPMLGMVMFLVAALLLVLIQVENDSRIDLARSNDNRDKLQFVASAIKADSYDVLLQGNLEVMTVRFLEDEYHRISTDSAGDQIGFNNDLMNSFIENMGPSLGLNLNTYAAAYRNIPGIKDCRVTTEKTYISRPSVIESVNDGTIRVTGESYGEQVECTSKEPEETIKVDISGRKYRVNIRVEDLYGMARDILVLSKDILGYGREGISEPIAHWESPRWFVIRKADNKIPTEGEGSLDNLVSGTPNSWEKEMERVEGGVGIVAETQMKKEGMGLEDIKISNMDGGEFGIDDMDVSCVEDGSGQYRNCIPYRMLLLMGDKECSWGMPPKGRDTPEFYLINRINTRCDHGSCNQDFDDVMKEIIFPLKNVCIDYYGRYDAVKPVCKKWEGKAKSALIRGAIKEANEEYVAGGRQELDFKFEDYETEIDTKDVRNHRLSCQGEGADFEKYEDNSRIILEAMRPLIGVEQDPESSMKRWVDRGTDVPELGDPLLQSVYKSVFGKDVLPKPCFIQGVRGAQDCENAGVPKVEIIVDWTDTKDTCIERADDLCNALCGGYAIEQFKEPFCNSLFPKEGVSVGEGTLSCEGGTSCGDTKVQIGEIRLLWDHL